MSRTPAETGLSAPGDPSVRVVAQPALASHGRGGDDSTRWPTTYLGGPPGELAGGRRGASDPKLASSALLPEGCRPFRSDGTDRATMICPWASGLERFRRDHPAVAVTWAAPTPVIDRGDLVSPGLGDAGGRLVGTVAT